MNESFRPTPPTVPPVELSGAHDPTTGRPRRAYGAGFKILLLGALVLILMIPASLVRDLIRERSARREEAQREISQRWGAAQQLVGPVLAVPYEGSAPCGDACVAVLLPSDLEWRGRLEPEVRKRGIFEAVVYGSRLGATARFDLARLAELAPRARRIQLERSRLVVGVGDLSGLIGEPRLRFGDRQLTFEPGSAGVPLSNAIHVPLTDLLDPAEAGGVGSWPSFEVSLELDLRGSGSLRAVPAGDQTRLELASTWPSPSFTGAALPQRRQIRGAGFEASWSVPHFARGFPRLFADHELSEPTLFAAAFGVELQVPAGGYQQSERSAKHAILFFVLAFALLFLLEVFGARRLHGMHYLLVGAALCLFHLLLLALTEHLGFATAYATASAATVALIGGYATAILGSRSAGATVVGVLGGLYGYLWVLLGAEDLALLLGTLGLFLVLGLLMFLTRRLDWSTLQLAPGAASAQERRGAA